MAPTRWAPPEIVMRAAEIAAVESNEHFRISAQRAIEAMLKLGELSGTPLAGRALADVLLEPAAFSKLLDTAKASSRFNPLEVPTAMLDVVIAHLFSTMNHHRFARIAAVLREQ